MRRREFLNRSGLGIAAVSFNYGWLLQDAFSENKYTDFKPADVKFKLHRDGSFDILTADLSLNKCYPAFDEKQLRPLRVQVEETLDEGRIKYDVAEGTVILYFRKNNGILSVSSELMGFSRAPRWFMPLGHASIKGAESFYKQGFGTSGPSGIFTLAGKIPEKEEILSKAEEQITESYLLSGIISPNSETLAWSVFENSGFLNRSSFSANYHRSGLGDKDLIFVDNYLNCGFSTENIVLAKEVQKIPAINFIAGNNPFQTFRNLMNASAKTNNTIVKNAAYFWCNANEKDSKFSYDQLYNFLNELKEDKEDFHLQSIQIGNDYCIPGDWLKPDSNWPENMEKTAELIKNHGYIPGIHIDPFIVSSKSELFKNHKDWILTDNGGNRIVVREYEDEKMYLLDTSLSGALAYLRSVFRTMYSYGFRFFKTGYMNAGYRDSTLVRRNNPGKTSSHYFTEVLEVIREEIGNESFWLADDTPFQPVISFVDAVGITSDTRAEHAQTAFQDIFREMHFGQVFNNLLWQNDPGLIYLRDENPYFSEEEKYSVAFFNGISGGIIKTSDNLFHLDESDQHVWKMLYPGNKPGIPDIHEWAKFDGIIELSKKLNEELFAYLIINLSDESCEIKMNIKERLKIATPFVYQWEKGEGFKETEFRGTIPFKLKAHESVLLYIGKDKVRKPGQYALSGLEIDK